LYFKFKLSQQTLPISRFRGVKGFYGRFEKGDLKPTPDWYTEQSSRYASGVHESETHTSSAIDLPQPKEAGKRVRTGSGRGGESSLERENARLRAELAAHVALLAVMQATAPLPALTPPYPYL
jgi:hypothetical protein